MKINRRNIQKFYADSIEKISLWRSQTVPIITAINFLLTRGRLPGGATDFEDGLEGGRQQASRGWQHHQSIIINSSGLRGRPRGWTTTSKSRMASPPKQHLIIIIITSSLWLS
ncbi:hypothetical protein TYRP_013348 [Tyrophagus putrescentiae]|nr:hypothetical protein TYRP_013348 [Tyrophagus putrescentiae]